MSVLGSLRVMTNKAPALNVWGNSPGIQHRFMYILATEVKNMPYKEYVLHSNLLLVLTSEMTHDSSLRTKHSKKIEDYYNAQNKFT